MEVVFIAAILPPLIVVIAWAAVTAIRICIPERPPHVQHRIWVRQQMEATRESTPVGAHEIRENQRRLLRRMQQAYSLSGARRVVDIWADELWARRN